MAKKRVSLVVEELGLLKLDELAEVGLSKGMLRRFAFGWGVYFLLETSERLVKVVQGEPVRRTTEEEIRELMQYVDDEEGEDKKLIE